MFRPMRNMKVYASLGGGALVPREGGRRAQPPGPRRVYRVQSLGRVHAVHLSIRAERKKGRGDTGATSPIAPPPPTHRTPDRRLAPPETAHACCNGPPPRSFSLGPPGRARHPSERPATLGSSNGPRRGPGPETRRTSRDAPRGACLAATENPAHTRHIPPALGRVVGPPRCRASSAKPIGKAGTSLPPRWAPRAPHNPSIDPIPIPNSCPDKVRCFPLDRKGVLCAQGHVSRLSGVVDSRGEVWQTRYRTGGVGLDPPHAAFGLPTCRRRSRSPRERNDGRAGRGHDVDHP